MIRFVEAPDGQIVADLRRRLPGRGVWVTATREALIAAGKKNVFARSLKKQVRVDADIVNQVETLMERSSLNALSFVKKAGELVTGHAKVELALKKEKIIGLVHAKDGAEDGIRKLAEISAARFGTIDGPPVVRLFTSIQLDLALGRSNVIHAALLAGRASEGFLTRAIALERFRQGPNATQRSGAVSADNAVAQD